MNELNDFKNAIWLTGALTIIGTALLVGYYDETKLAVLAGTIIFGIEYWNLKREFNSYKNKK